MKTPLVVRVAAREQTGTQPTWTIRCERAKYPTFERNR
jgi:hypothetical protein